MSWYCAQGADCVSPHTDGKGGHTLTDWLEIAIAESMAKMFGVPFENSEANSGDPPPHGLCGYCWLALNGSFPIHLPNGGIRDELVRAGSESAGAGRGAPDAQGADIGRTGGPVETGRDRSSRSGVVAATVASWAYEARCAYLRRMIEHFPQSVPWLISEGFWTGAYADDGTPEPSEVAFHSGAWQAQVSPVYDSSEPVLNRLRSLRDTLIVSPDSGERLIAAGLWTGEYELDGLPIPTPQTLDASRPRRMRGRKS